MGLFDVDVMVVSVTQLVPTPLAVASGASAVLIGVAANLETKIAIAAVYGKLSFAARYAYLSAASIAAGSAVWWLQKP